MKNPKWERDELILALDLYFRHTPTHISDTHPAVIKLSQILNALPIHTDRPDEAKFRNANGVYMKMCNFLRFDPAYHGKGLQRGGKLEEIIWNEFSPNPHELHKVANEIIEGVHKPSQIASVKDEEEDDFPEGKVLYRRHRYFERNRTLIKSVKDKALLKGNLHCLVCNFDFFKSYGKLGEGYIECHHTVPISDYGASKKTRIQDIALVCSNCHRMLHRRRPWLCINELSNLMIDSSSTDS